MKIIISILLCLLYSIVYAQRLYPNYTGNNGCYTVLKKIEQPVFDKPMDWNKTEELSRINNNKLLTPLLFKSKLFPLLNKEITIDGIPLPYWEQDFYRYVPKEKQKWTSDEFGNRQYLKSSKIYLFLRCLLP